MSTANSSLPIIQVHKISKQYNIGIPGRLSFGEKLLTIFSRFKTPHGDVHRLPPEKKHFWALKDVSFEVRRGEVLGIIGKNGSGKSTLLKILSRITKPTSGRAIIEDSIVSMLEVGTGFHPELTGRENVYLSGTIIGMKKADIDRKFKEILEFSGIGRFIDTPVKHYSSGMYVRLAFSVSTQLVSEIILIDEVLAVGDADFQRKSLSRIDELRQRGKTVILVSHNFSSLSQLCDRVLWLENGQIKKIADYKVIAAEYLNQGSPPSGIIEFPKQDNSTGAQITQAFTSYQDRVSSEIPYDNPVTVTINFTVDRKIEDLRIGFRIWNNLNVPILRSNTNDSDNLNVDQLGDPGGKSISVQIPRFSLTPAKYFVEIEIWSPNVEHHHHVQKAFSFKVVSSTDLEGNTAEFRPKLNWYRS